MEKLNCPLCQSHDTRILETINTYDILMAYLRHYDIKINFREEKLHYMACSSCELHFFNPMVTGSEDLYEKLQRFDWYYMAEKPEYLTAEKYIPKSGRILEVGAGKASFVEFVGKERYVGLEFNDEAIKRAKASGINLIKESIENHAVHHAKKYSAIVSFQVLEHVSNPSAFIQGCVDALQIGGRLILAVPNNDGICGIAQNSILDLPPHHVSHWSEKTMIHIATQYNLKLVSVDCEAVAKFHSEWAAHSIYNAKIREILGLHSSLIDTSTLAKIISKTAGIFARLSPPDLAEVKGHTVLACYEKI